MRKYTFKRLSGKYELKDYRLGVKAIATERKTYTKMSKYNISGSSIRDLKRSLRISKNIIVVV